LEGYLVVFNGTKGRIEHKWKSNCTLPEMGMFRRIKEGEPISKLYLLEAAL
jgi:hypothetical protein